MAKAKKSKSKDSKQAPATEQLRPVPKQVHDIATRCIIPECASTDREPYYATIEREIPGVDENGQHYTHIIWRRTKCSKCGQSRTDISRENRG